MLQLKARSLSCVSNSTNSLQLTVSCHRIGSFFLLLIPNRIYTTVVINYRNQFDVWTILEPSEWSNNDWKFHWDLRDPFSIVEFLDFLFIFPLFIVAVTHPFWLVHGKEIKKTILEIWLELNSTFLPFFLFFDLSNEELFSIKWSQKNGKQGKKVFWSMSRTSIDFYLCSCVSVGRMLRVFRVRSFSSFKTALSLLELALQQPAIFVHRKTYRAKKIK